MKKTSLIFAIFIALALVFMGCPGEGDNAPPPGGGPDEPGGGPSVGPGEDSLQAVFTATVLDSEKAKITISGNNITAVAGTSTTRFDADLLTGEGGFNASAYKGIKFEYKTTQQVNVGLQDCGDSSSMWLITDWGAFTESEWTPVECVFSTDLMKAWGSSTAFDKSKLEKIWIGCDNPTKDTKFEIRNFTFVK